jgi:hypothetical protein
MQRVSKNLIPAQHWIQIYFCKTVNLLSRYTIEPELEPARKLVNTDLELELAIRDFRAITLQ